MSWASRMFGRAEPDPFEAIRQTIAAIDDQRRSAAANAGRALVNQAEVERALQDQLRQLARARAQIEDNLTIAGRAADGARADGGDLAAMPYDITVDSLQTALDIVAASHDQLAGLHDVSQSNIERARELLAGARRTLDTALRDQVRLLLELERTHRAHLVAQARRDRGAR